jgi:hypothetical protein
MSSTLLLFSFFSLLEKKAGGGGQGCPDAGCQFQFGFHILQWEFIFVSLGRNVFSLPRLEDKRRN